MKVIALRLGKITITRHKILESLGWHYQSLPEIMQINIT
jgi:hypothetical protein